MVYEKTTPIPQGGPRVITDPIHGVNETQNLYAKVDKTKGPHVDRNTKPKPNDSGLYAVVHPSTGKEPGPKRV